MRCQVVLTSVGVHRLSLPVMVRVEHWDVSGLFWLAGPTEDGDGDWIVISSVHQHGTPLRW